LELDGFHRLHRVLRHLYLLLRQQHAVKRLHRLEDKFLVGAVQLLLRRRVHELRAVQCLPALCAVE